MKQCCYTSIVMRNYNTVPVVWWLNLDEYFVSPTLKITAFLEGALEGIIVVKLELIEDAPNEYI